jgi:hypothetical protein
MTGPIHVAESRRSDHENCIGAREAFTKNVPPLVRRTAGPRGVWAPNREITKTVPAYRNDSRKVFATGQSRRTAAC